MKLEEINIDKLNIKELKELHERVGQAIYQWDDGHIYICEISSFGTTFQEVHTNFEMVEELSWKYNGDRGIMDVYTTNKDFESDVYISGDVYFIESQEVFEEWKEWAKEYQSYAEFFEMWKAVDEWDEEYSDNSNLSYMFTQPRRPIEPSIPKEKLLQRLEELNTHKETIIEPRPLYPVEEGDI